MQPLGKYGLQSWLRLVFGVAVAAVLALLAEARAEAEVPLGDRAAIRDVISRQLDAFRQDDAALAFSYATPDIQAKFGSAETFLEMVRTGYQPVYRPRSVEFREIVDIDGVPAQTVLVVGPDGRPKLAVYPMEQLPGGEWRIGGCYLVDPPGADA